MRNTLASGLLNILPLASIICFGYIVSLFLTYGFIVMPGLSIIDDRSFVAAFQGLESRFAFESSGYMNIPAMVAFPGALVLPFFTILIHPIKLGKVWAGFAWLLFLVGIVSTALINLPANEFIYSAGPVDTLDIKQVRETFNEEAWTRWNHFRTVTTLLALLCMLKARKYR